MKRFTAILLSCVLSALAINPVVQADGIEETVYMKMDFEDGNRGFAPLGALAPGDNLVHISLIDAENANFGGVEIDSSIGGLGNKMLSVGHSHFGMYGFRPAATGTLRIEFDALVGLGGLGVGFGKNDNGGGVGTRFPLVFQRGTGMLTTGTSGNWYAGTTTYVSADDNTQPLTFTPNKWSHITMDIGMAEGECIVTADGVRSAPIDCSYLLTAPITSIGFIHAIGGGGYSAAYDKTAYVDNVKLSNIAMSLQELSEYPNTVESVDFIDSDGEKMKDMSKISTLLSQISVNFAEPLKSGSEDKVTLLNVTDNTEVEIDKSLSPRKNSVCISPKIGYLKEKCDYKLVVDKSIENVRSVSLTEDYIVEFTTAEGLMKVFGISICDADGNELTAAVPGTTVYLAVDYAKSGNFGDINANLAYTATNDGELTAMGLEAITLSNFGRNTFKKQVDLAGDLTFDKLNMYLWDAVTGMPIVPKTAVDNI